VPSLPMFLPALPLPVSGSQFDELDQSVLGAIGQMTTVNETQSLERSARDTIVA